MIVSENIIIHLGLHKTGSTYLQRIVFPQNAAQLGFLSVRRKKELSDFGQYLLRENDITYSSKKAYALLTKDNLFKVTSDTRLLLSDEQFSGSPWNSAKDRKRNFDRLHELFPNAGYVLVLRNQEVLTQSLYLEYIKKGGTAHWSDFLTYKGNDLDFSRGSYMQFYEYCEYVVSQIGGDRLKVLYYEELQENAAQFFSKMEAFIGEKIEIKATSETKNPSIGGIHAKRLRFFNRILSSDRQPFMLLPKRWWYVLQKRLIAKKTKEKFIIPERAVKEFCASYKENNIRLPEPDVLKKYGYIQ